MAKRWRVGIVGCGVAGLAAAVLLGRSGHRVTLIEAFRSAITQMKASGGGRGHGTRRCIFTQFGAARKRAG